MKIVCDSCGAKYSIADEKVAGKIFKIRCKKCASVLEVRGDPSGSQASDNVSAAQDPGGEATWYIVIDGEQKGPLRPIELSQLFAKGSVGLDSYVWKQGFDDWKVAGDVAELGQVFGGAASRAKAAPRAEAAPVEDDTDSNAPFGPSGDLFSEAGRESTSEIDTSSSVFAGFEDNPTTVRSDRAPLAAASQREASGSDLGGVSSGFGGGVMASSTPQRMTGQRNENSVLFSLGNLQQLASRGGAPADVVGSGSSQAPAQMVSQAPTQASGEGSGLIDIRALAKATTPGTKGAPSQGVDDLLSIGTGGAALGAPLLGPAPAEASEGNRWLWIAGAAVAVIAIVGAGVGVGVAIGGSEDDALEISVTGAGEPRPGQQVPGSSQVATAAQRPSDPPEQALAKAEPAEERVEVADIEDEPVRAAPELQEASPREPATSPSTTKRRRARPAKTTATQKQEPAPERKRSGGSLDALMDEVVGGSSAPKPKKTASSSPRPSDSSLPATPTRNEVKTALQGVSGAVKACRKDVGGTATVDVVFSGKTGRVSSAKVTSGPFKGTPVGACIGKAVKRARVSRFQRSTFKVTFPYRL